MAEDTRLAHGECKTTVYKHNVYWIIENLGSKRQRGDCDLDKLQFAGGWRRRSVKHSSHKGRDAPRHKLKNLKKNLRKPLRRGLCVDEIKKATVDAGKREKEGQRKCG